MADGKLAMQKGTGLGVSKSFMTQEVQDFAMKGIKKCPNPVKLTFNNLNFTVQDKNGHPLRIVKNVSGYAMPG